MKLYRYRYVRDGEWTAWAIVSELDIGVLLTASGAESFQVEALGEQVHPQEPAEPSEAPVEELAPEQTNTDT